MHPRRLAIVTASIVGGALAFYLGCSVYDTSLLVDAAPDTGTGDGNTDPCAHARWPLRPEKDDPGADIEVVNAIRVFDLGLTPDAGPPAAFGFDLDYTCTCPAPESCRLRVANTEHCDDDAGRDNSGGDLLRKFSGLAGDLFKQETINDRLQKGYFTLLMRLRRYNGMPNDSSVELSIFVSPGTPTEADAGTPILPKWDGTDQWNVSSDSVFGGTGDGGSLIPNYVDIKAYVSGGVLVGSLDFPLSLGRTTSGAVTLDLSGAIITAPLVKDGSSFRMKNGHLTGRWPTKKLLVAVHAIANPLGTGNLCPGIQTYEDLKQQICRAADIMSDPKTDNQDQACDALSLGVTFDSAPAKLGSVVKEPAVKDPCPDAGPDDCK